MTTSKSNKRQCIRTKQDIQKHKNSIEDDNQEAFLGKVQETITAVEKIDEEIDSISEMQAKEVLKIEYKYNLRKRPLMEKRKIMLQDIPKFWKQTLMNHPLVGNLIEETDEPILDALTAVDVKYEGEDGSFKVEFSFKENPYFSNSVLWKSLLYDEKDTVNVNASNINWKSTKEATDITACKSSFFEWFSSSDPDHEIAELIKDEVWKNPVQFYLNVRDADDEAEGFIAFQEQFSEENDEEDDEE